jgi:hypothetical protein
MTSEEEIDTLFHNLILGKIKISSVDVFVSDTLMKIKKLKLQLYFKKLVEENLGSIESKIKNKPVTKKIDKIQNNTLKKVKNKTISTKKQEFINRYVLTYDMLENKTIEEVSVIVGQSSKRLLLLINKFNSNIDINSIFDKPLWSDTKEILSRWYKLKVRHNSNDNSMIDNVNKKILKFKPSLGIPGNYSKLIYIRSKT